MTKLEDYQTLASEMIEAALDNCAEKFHNNNSQFVLEDLRKKKRKIWLEFSESLGRLLAVHIGNQFPEVVAIFTYSSDPDTIRQAGIKSSEKVFSQNILVWTNSQLPDLDKHLANINDCFSEIILRLGLCPASDCLIPVHYELIDDDVASSGQGLGLLTKSQRIISHQVWPKEEFRQSPIHEDGKQDEKDRLLSILNSYDPVLASAERSIEHGRAIEVVPPEQRGPLEYHLIRLKVGLIRKLISDQLFYIDTAKKWFTIEDLADIYNRRIGHGRIGGKAAGMLLAARILNEVGGEEITSNLVIPDSFFLGSDLLSIFMAMNGLTHWNDQKYKPRAIIQEEYALIKKEFMAGDFPPEVIEELKNILDQVGSTPLVVRSSSQLEDNFGTVFAGKYDSYFCPNQGSKDARLGELLSAIKKVYASTLKPEALFYRKSRGLQDYDERMAVLIQTVQGERFGDFFLPQVAGVAFSNNLYRWSPEIRREEGFARLVWGLGTRAVGRVDNDYPRIVALSHPLLHPDDAAESIHHYSQHSVDLINLNENKIISLPVKEVLTPAYKPLRYMAQLYDGSDLRTPRMRVTNEDIPNLTITYDEFLAKTPFVKIIKGILNVIEENYHKSVDIEFTAEITDLQSADPGIKISLLQCRPQPHLQDTHDIIIPEDLPVENLVFSTRFMVPRGYLRNIRHVLFIHPKHYFALGSQKERAEVTHLISQINALLEDKSYICVGPGRWGSVNTDLGVGVNYADIYNAAVLVEVTGEGIGTAPEPSLGTHFFQDLMEAQIYPIALYLDDPNVEFNQEFFYSSPNRAAQLIEVPDNLKECIRLIDIQDIRPGEHLEIVMDDEASHALAYFAKD